MQEGYTDLALSRGFPGDFGPGSRVVTGTGSALWALYVFHGLSGAGGGGRQR